MNRTFMRWPNFKRKAVTLSYDDGVSADKRLIPILDKNGLKCTFNINSGMFAQEEGAHRMTKKTAYDLYANSPHEVAVHGVRHYSLASIPTNMAMSDVLNDRIALEEMFGKLVQGMAYANGSYNDEVVEILQKAGIKYARTVISTEKFDVPTDWLRLPATCHHNNRRLMELAKNFVEAPNDLHFFKLPAMLFYLWGHSYEFDNDNNWNVIEEFAEYMGGREDIWYVTNGEVYDYVKAFDDLQYSGNGKFIYNPSALDVYVCFFGKEYLIPAGETIMTHMGG